MKKNIPWWVSIIVAAVFYVLCLTFKGSVIGDFSSLGVLIFLALGIVALIASFFKKN